MFVTALAALAACGGGGGGGGGGKGGSGGSGSSTTPAPVGTAGIPDAGADVQPDGGPTCAAVAACGGGVVGRWTITDTCASLDLGAVCGGTTIQATLTFAGTQTFNADLTYAQVGSAGGTLTYHFPASCIGAQTCAQVRDRILSAGSPEGMGFLFQSATCTSERGGCACDAILSNIPTNETGTYSTSGGTLTTVHDGTIDATPYCVNGDTMHQMPADGEPETGAIVLTRAPSTDPTDTWQIFKEPTRKVDLLFMIDNSSSMEPLQTKLQEQLPVFMNVLKMSPTGDGTTTGLPDVHVAVISSDTGPGKFDLPDDHCRYKGDQGAFQTQPRGACAASPLIGGQTFLQASNNQAQKNYVGDIADAFSCIAALGHDGCGFEGPLKSVRWALDPLTMPPGNRGFLRDDAYLGVVLLTNGDDCSVPDDSDLLDPLQQHMSDPDGPFSSFRCNEFGHLCNINGSLQHPLRGVNSNLTSCISDDTATGRETKVADEVAFLKGLKADPSQVLVAAIAGPTVPYDVEMQNRTLTDGTIELQPSTDHSCVQNTGEYGDPAIRIQQWVQGFGDHGLMQTVCAPSFAPALMLVASALGKLSGPSCLSGPFRTNPTTQQPDCRVVDRDTSSGSGRIDTVVPNCAEAGAGQVCWTLSDNPNRCPEPGSKLLVVNRFGTAAPTQGTAVTCEPCPVGRSEIGCP